MQIKSLILRAIVLFLNLWLLCYCSIAADQQRELQPQPGVPPLNLRTIDRSTNLPTDNVNFIFQDKSGLVWICSDKTVSHILPWGEVSVAGPEDGLLHAPVLSMGQTTDGWLYVGTQQGGLYNFNGVRYERVAEWQIGERSIAQLVSDNQNNLYIDAGHEIGVLTRDKRYKPFVLMGHELNYKLFKLQTGQVMLASKGGYRILSTDPGPFIPYPKGLENCLPVASTLGGLVFQQSDRVVIMQYSNNQLSVTKTFPDLGRHISSALMLPDGRWLFGYRDLGMVMIDGQHQYKYTSTNYLLGNYVKYLFLDRENSVWIAQYGNGIQHMSEHYLWFYPRQTGFEESSLVTIAGAPDAQHYAAATSSRFYIIKDHIIHSIKDTALTNIRAMQFLTSKKLVALSELGVFLVDVLSSTQVKTRLLGHISGGLDLIQINESHDHFFVSTTTSLYLLTANSVKKLVDYPAGAAISKIRKNGNHFYALGKNGYAIQLSAEGQVLRIWEQRQGVPKTSINDLGYDNKGQCWLASDSGLYRLDEQKQRFIAYKPYRVAYPMLFQYRGRLWAMSEKTLYQYQDTGWCKTNSYKTISNEKGAINLAKFSPSTNQILTATSRGMVISNLDRWRVYRGTFQMIYLSSTTDGFWERSQNPNKIRVHEGTNYVRWKYQITDYNCNGDVRFHIRTIKNSDTTYSVTSNKDFSFTKPEAGDYLITIFGLGQDGVKTDNQLTFELTVIPLWYKQGWFIFLMCTLLIGLVWISAQGYSSYLYRQKMREIKTIQRIQAERERISRDLHDSVGSQLVYMVNALEQVRRADTQSVKGAESQLMAHERFADKLKELTNLARTTIQNLRESIWVLHQGGEIELNNFVDRLRRYFDQVKAIAHIRIQENIKIETEAKLTPVQALNLFRIVQEAVTNAAKHSDSKLIAFELVQTDDLLMLKVQDFGRGFSQNNAGSVGNRMTDSYGLTNMQYRADEINASLKIASVSNEGTTISLELSIAQR